MRNAQQQASNAYNNATSTASGLGASASGIGANLTPFLTSELQHPQGYGAQGMSAMLSSALGGSGGATSGLEGEANLAAARSGNAGGYQAALADAARSRSKASAGASEGVAAQNAQLQAQQQQDAAKGLQGLYGTDTSGMLSAMGQQADDVNAEVNAGKSGWLQNLTGVLQTLQGGASAAGNLGWKPLS